MNFVHRYLAEEGMRDRVGTSEEIEASLLPVLDLLAEPLTPASSSCSVGLFGRLMQRLRRVVQDSGVIVRDGVLIVILPNKLADPLDMQLLEL